MSKASETARNLLDQVSEKRRTIAQKMQAITRTQDEIAELEREATWLAGEDRRKRLNGYADRAKKLAENATDNSAEIAAAAQRVTDSVRALIAAASTHNAELEDVVESLKAEGVKNSHTPPSPADGGVGTTGSNVIVGEHHVIPLDTRALVASAVEAGNKPDGTAKIPALIVHRPLVTNPTCRFWIHPVSGTHIADHQLHECSEITRAEYLAIQWKLHISDLPQEILDEIEATDRARIAGQLLAELPPDERNAFAEQLLPARKESA